MPESLQDAISTAIDETEDKLNETATQISDLQQEVYVLEGTIDSLDSLNLSLDRCPYCLSRYQKQSFLAETQDSFGEEYLYCRDCGAEFEAG